MRRLRAQQGAASAQVWAARQGDSARSVGTEEGCSAYPRELCEHWRRVMLQNLKPMVAVHPAAGSSGGE